MRSRFAINTQQPSLAYLWAHKECNMLRQVQLQSLCQHRSRSRRQWRELGLKQPRAHFIERHPLLTVLFLDKSAVLCPARCICCGAVDSQVGFSAKVVINRVQTSRARGAPECALNLRANSRMLSPVKISKWSPTHCSAGHALPVRSDQRQAGRRRAEVLRPPTLGHAACGAST